MFAPAWILLMALSAPLAAGAPAPQLDFKDIDGASAATTDFDGWIVVYTFADRESSDPLMAWQDRANLAISKRHPGLRIAHVNFADVTAVPSMFRGVVEPILRAINSRAMKRMAAGYKEAGVAFDPGKARFHLIPDWKGRYLEAFGLKDATMYHCWIAVDGKIVSYVNADTPDAEQAFVRWFDGYAPAATTAAP